jgi:hypothetical protein
MQQEESLDLCSIVRSFFGPIVDFDQNLSSPEFIFVVMVIFLPLLFLPIGRVECTLLDLQKGIEIPLLKRQERHSILKEAFTTLLEELQLKRY